MQAILDSAHAWFFESASQGLSGDLNIRLVEGIKGADRQFVEVGGTELGPFYPVQVQPHSRCVQVTFEKALVFFAYDESYDAADPELRKGAGRFLFVAESSSFRKFSESRTSVAQLHQGAYQEFLLCCEDRIFHVLSVATPNVVLLQEKPDLTKERTNTWSAS
jgi:hypothetical protein